MPFCSLVKIITMKCCVQPGELLHKAVSGNQLMSTGHPDSNCKRIGSVVECLTGDQRVAGSCLIGATAHINPCLVLVQPRNTSRETRPDITEKVLTVDVKNQIKQNQLGNKIILSCLFRDAVDNLMQFCTRPNAASTCT